MILAHFVQHEPRFYKMHFLNSEIPWTKSLQFRGGTSLRFCNFCTKWRGAIKGPQSRLEQAV